jgi:hypothetical protein
VAQDVAQRAVVFGGQVAHAVAEARPAVASTDTAPV